MAWGAADLSMMALIKKKKKSHKLVVCCQGGPGLQRVYTQMNSSPSESNNNSQ